MWDNLGMYTCTCTWTQKKTPAHSVHAKVDWKHMPAGNNLAGQRAVSTALIGCLSPEGMSPPHSTDRGGKRGDREGSYTSKFEH